MIHLDMHGTRIPALGLGTFQLPSNTATYMVEAALDIGYRHIDSAQIYDNEANVGLGLRRTSVPREEFFLTTKVWVDNIRSNSIQRSVENSLKNLQTEYVDLLLLHWPTPDVPFSQSLAALSELTRSGKARHVGISNYNCQQIQDACAHSDIPLLTNQVEYHTYLNQNRVLETLRQNNMCLTAYSPLAQGKLLNDAVLQAIGQKHGKTVCQVALRWLIQQGQVMAIPRSSKLEHAKENLDIFDFELSTDDMKTIDQLTSNQVRVINPEHLAPTWD